MIVNLVPATPPGDFIIIQPKPLKHLAGAPPPEKISGASRRDSFVLRNNFAGLYPLQWIEKAKQFLFHRYVGAGN
jgi:hypothetical protein